MPQPSHVDRDHQRMGMGAEDYCTCGRSWPHGQPEEDWWSMPICDMKPAQGHLKHEPTELDNGFGGYLCTCGRTWPHVQQVERPEA